MLLVSSVAYVTAQEWNTVFWAIDVWTAEVEKEEYIKVEKSFIDRKPNTRYSATQIGRAAFKKHIEALEKLIGK